MNRISRLIKYIHILFVVTVIATGECVAQNQALQFYQRSLDKRLPFQENVHAAKQALASAAEWQQTASKDSLINLIHTQLGILYWNDGQFKSALTHLNSSERLCQQQHDLFSLAKVLHYKGLVYYYRCDFDSALILYAMAEKEYRYLKKDSAVAKLMSHKGLIYNVQGKYDLAIENLMESFRLQESMPGYRDQSVSLQLPSPAANELYYQSKLAKDLESVTFLEAKKDIGKLAFAYFNIGKDYHYLKQYSNAIPYLRRSCNLYQELKQLPFTGDLAAAYAAVGNIDSAKYFYGLRLNDVKAAGTQIHLAAVYTDLGAFYWMQKKWDEALYYFDLGLDLNHQMGLQRAEATLGKAKAEVLLTLDKLPSSLDVINHSLSIAQSIGSIKDMEEFLRVKSKILSKLQLHDEAFLTLELSQILSDSIANGESRLRVVQLQIEYETDKKSRDVVSLSAINKLKQAEIENKNLLLVIGMIVVVLGIVSVIFLFGRYRQKVKNEKILQLKNDLIEKQNIQLQLQTDERGALLQEIHHRVKNNLQLIASLINLQSSQVANPEVARELEKTRTRIMSIALIHQKLYQHENMSLIDLKGFLENLIENILSTMPEEMQIKRDIDIASVKVEVETAISIGLMVNELVTNSIKHGLTGVASPALKIQLVNTDNKIILTVEDNGLRKESQTANQSQSGFGLRLIEILLRRLSGTMQTDFQKGCRIRIEIGYQLM